MKYSQEHGQSMVAIVVSHCDHSTYVTEDVDNRVQQQDDVGERDEPKSSRTHVTY